MPIAAPTAPANDKRPYDEERLQREPVPRRSSWPRKYLRFPRPRRVVVCLLLIDLIIVGLVVRSFEPLITLLRRNEELFGSRLVLSRDAPHDADHHTGRHTIPRILHQTCANETIPEKWAAPQQSCKDTYSDFEYKLWTDKSARDFISSEYPWFTETWDNYAFPIQRADAIRYFILYHFGGIYLDMDTQCNETIPLHQIESDNTMHHAVFKSTTPTGVSNDLMISSPRHPLFAATISKLLPWYDFTHLWARLQPYCAIMISSGPFFLTMAIKNYLLEQPSLPSPTVQVVNATILAPYITDLESASWHKGDAKALMWVGTHQWVWFTLGGMGLVAGLLVINQGLLLAYRGVLRRVPSVAYNMKAAKLT
ncbi:Mannosyl phosphorylinositol ceramide synthase sur1 [Pleurostoma richardsiae]|uniref:Mannosyl phosphorylinositol ceramide synthase sur1 n=1 Tax=Pleurostoma richardsiae TaxID=41990 RepID=A0AA38VE75_9PEZI|nr:Mannosyl phosphorylinositol ceramide synthase sur1 [Pleurostoma richardsiae]